MLAITLQDLRFRARQFAIAVVGAGLVFSMTLLLSGLSGGFSAEINQTVQGLGAKTWLLATDGARGGIGSLPPIPLSVVGTVSRQPGVKRADPVIVAGQAAQLPDGDSHGINLVGYDPGGLGTPANVSGQEVTGAGQAVVDTALGLGVGQTFNVSGNLFKVVGTVSNQTLLGGIPNVFVTLSDAQAVVFNARPLISAVLTTGNVSPVSSKYEWYSSAAIERASLAQMSNAVSSINSSRILMWIIAIIIVAALVYVSALERTRDFAVLKALGSSSRLLFFGLAAQAVTITLAAAILAVIISNFMTGIFDERVDIPASAFITLPISAIVVGIIASITALRRAVSADPAAAFAGP
jgi:putative ABC transport system permease protein